MREGRGDWGRREVVYSEREGARAGRGATPRDGWGGGEAAGRFGLVGGPTRPVRVRPRPRHGMDGLDEATRPARRSLSQKCAWSLLGAREIRRHQRELERASSACGRLLICSVRRGKMSKTRVRARWGQV